MQPTRYWFRGMGMGRRHVYGLLTKKKIRATGEYEYAIATGNCTAGETCPVRADSIGIFTGLYDRQDRPIFEGDVLVYYDDPVSDKFQMRWNNMRARFELVMRDETSIPISQVTARDMQVIDQPFEP